MHNVLDKRSWWYWELKEAVVDTGKASSGLTFVSLVSNNNQKVLLQNHTEAEHLMTALPVQGCSGDIQALQHFSLHIKHSGRKLALVVSVFPVPAGPAGAPPKNMPSACDKVT